MSEPRHIEGAVSVNGDITPITRKKITQINSEKWAEMSVSDLIDQRSTIEERIYAANRAGHADLSLQLRRGLTALDSLIQQNNNSREIGF